MTNSLPYKIASLEKQLQQVKKGQRLSHGASIENAALEVNDGNGSLRTIVGVQGDGTVGVQAVNGPPPPQPSAPIVTSTIGGVTAAWDGQFANGAVIPMDWARIEVHASVAAVFEPIPETLRSTIETAQGATAVVPTDDPVYVRLVARNTSGTASIPSTAVGPVSKAPVVANDILDGIVTEVKLAEDAVTAAKIAPGAVSTEAIADAAVLAGKLADNAVKLGKIDTGAVTLNALGGALSDSAKQRYVDAMGEAAAWTTVGSGTGATWTHLTGVPDAPTGQTVGQAAGFVQQLGTVTVPYEPGVLYRVSARVRLTVAGSSGTDSMFIGVAGRGTDGVTLVNRLGTTGSLNSHTYPAASNRAITVGDGWVTLVGYLNGRAATGASGSAGPNNDPRSPGVVHADVRYLSPYLWLNYAEQGVANSPSRMQVDAFTIEALKTGVVDSTNLVAGSVTTAALATDSVVAGKVAADAISARELQVNSVTAAELAAGSVTAQAIAAGSISTEKLTVTTASSIVQKLYDSGGDAAAWRAGGTSTTTTTSIANLTSVSVTDAQTGGKVMRAVGAVSGAWRPDLLIPFDPNVLYRISGTVRQTVAGSNTAQQRVYLGVAGVDASGTLVNVTGAASTGSQHYVAAAGLNLTAGAGWQRITGYLKGYAAGNGTGVACPQPTAPGSLHANARFISPYFFANYEDGTGTTEVNLITVEVVETGAVQSVNIADGAITAPKIVAGAVQAGAIAASAVTTAKLDALSVTADKLAVNSVTADKILAGSITATALSADAITGKTITGGTINGTTINGVTVTSGTLQTNTAGSRVVLTPTPPAGIVQRPTMLVYSGVTGEISPAVLNSGPSTNTAQPEMVLAGPALELDPSGIVSAPVLAFRGGKQDSTANEFFVTTNNSNTTSAVGYATVYGTAATSTSGTSSLNLYARDGSTATTALSRVYVTGGYVNIAANNVTHTFWPDGLVLTGGLTASGNASIQGTLSAGNIASGTISITPSAPNTPSSALVTFSVTGTTVRGFATANSTVPGTRVNATPSAAGVTGVSVSSVTNTSMLVWVNRENTTATTVNWQVIGS